MKFNCYGPDSTVKLTFKNYCLSSLGIISKENIHYYLNYLKYQKGL